MKEEQKSKIRNYFEHISGLEADEIVALVNKHLDDEVIEDFVDHIEDFYGVEDDEELGVLAQIMISGYVLAKETE